MAYEFTRKTDGIDDVLAQDVNELQAALEAHEHLTLKEATELTIASGAITVTQACHKLQPESGTSDDLTDINGMDAGDLLVLYLSDPGTDVITIKHGTGNIACPGAADITFEAGFLLAYYDGTTVYITGGGGGGGGGVTDHGALTGLADDDHTQYIKHALATAANDFLVASGSGAFAKKTLAETLTALGKAAASGLASLDASSKVVQDPANATATPTASKIPIANGSGKLDGWISAASDTVSGIAEAATIAETDTGTDTGKFVTPDGLAGSNFGERCIGGQITDASSALSIGDGKAYLPAIPSSMTGMNIVGIIAEVLAPSTSGVITIQLARGRQAAPGSAHSWVDVCSTKITIDQNEYSSEDATTAYVINTSNDDLATGDLLRVDIDGVGSGPTTPLILTIIARMP